MRRFALVIAASLFVAPLALAQQAATGTAPAPTIPIPVQAHFDGPPTSTVTVQAGAPQPAAGGVIDFKSFGWLSPIIDDLVQFLVLALLGWFFKSRYSAGLDQTSRDALRTFSLNAANSLLADGAVALQNKTISISNAALAGEINSAATRIPGALKRFGIDVTTPDGAARLGAFIEDHVGQTQAGAAMLAAAHTTAAPATPAPTPAPAPPASPA